ncbi:MAG: FtsX-like permease family protein [Betaproteobacteria bacterium]|nr:FtsX-like permease family protein [Betaproteobacteria bacterium]
MKSFKMGVRNTLNNWRHSLGSMLSVAIGFAALTLFNGYISVVQDMYEDNYRQRSMFGDVMIEKSRNGKAIDFEDSRINEKEQQFIENFITENRSLVDQHARFLIVSGFANNGKSSAIYWGFGYDLEKGRQLRDPTWPWNSKAGKPLDLQSEDAVMLGEDIGDTFGCVPERNERLLTKVGGYTAVERPFRCERPNLQLTVTTDSGQVNAMAVTIGALGGVGLRGIDSWYLMMSLPKAQALHDTRDISHIRLRLKDKKMFGTFVERFNSAASSAQLELRAFDWREHILARVYKRTMSLFLIFRDLVSAVILTISGMSVLNAMVKSVNERQREIGTLRSLGFRGSRIISIFTTEGVVIGLFGSAVGGALSVVASLFLNRVEFIYYAGFLSDPVPFVIGLVPRLYLYSLFILCSIAAIASFFAARRAVKISIPALLSST